ncbi:MAG: PAS domain-containing protein, partial [Bdellovibrionales bacterium]
MKPQLRSWTEDLHNFPGIVAVFSGLGRVIYHNEAFAQLPDRPLANSTCSKELLIETARHLSSRHDCEIFEMGMNDTSGPILWYRCVAKFEPSTSHITICCVETTEEKKREERLRRAQKMLIDAQGIAHLGTWEWEPKLGRVVWSDELYQIYALTPQQHTPTFQNYLTKIHPMDRERVQKTMLEALREHKSFSHDERILRPDGSIRYLHTWGYPVLDSSQNLIRLVGVCQDVTDRALAEELGRQSEERYRRIVETADEGIWSVDKAGRTDFVNKKMAKILGYDESELLGKDPVDFIDKEHKQLAKINIKLRRRGMVSHEDFKFRRKDGTQIWTNVAASPLYDSNGKFCGRLAVINDVTERRK